MPTMPTRPTTSQAPEKVKPAEVFSFKSMTMLDAIFTSKSKKKPAWATTTMGSKTTMWRVSRRGNLEEVASIRWSSVPDSSLHSSAASKNSGQKVVLVEINGELYPAEKFGKRSGGGLTNPGLTYTFKVDDMECRWSARETGPDSMQASHAWTASLPLECTADILTKKVDPLQESRSLSSSRPVTAPAAAPISTVASGSTQSRFKSFFTPFKKATSKPHTESVTLAEYYHAWSVHQTATIALYESGVPYTFYLLISLILVNAKKDEWKHVQSSITPEELRAVLNADLTGNLPMYTPARTESTAKTKGNKRPRTATNLHPTVSVTTPWRWDAHGTDHDRVGNPLNLAPEGSQATST